MQLLPSWPVGGQDYPRTQTEFQRWFPDSAPCDAFLSNLRWPNGLVCPYCQCPTGRPRKSGFIQCTYCLKETSVTSGTVLESTRKSLLEGFTAAWYVTHRKDGGAALGLQRTLGFGSYQTAWAWLHELRRAMVRPGRDLLSGVIEVDEVYIGGVEKGVRGRQTETKSIVVIAAEVRGNNIGRIRMGRVPNLKAETLTAFVQSVAYPGSTIRTDGFLGYVGLTASGYKHQVINLSDSSDPAHVLMPRVHRIATLVKRWLLSPHQGAVRGPHLDYYLAEFTFRFNRRSSKHRGLLFYRLLEQAMMVDHTPYKNLLDPNRKRRTRKS